jgi:hypothetical protein
MAKYTPGAIVSEIRGTIAATTHSRNRGKAIMRNRVTPINRRSTTQSQRRQQMASFASQFRGLDQAQIAGWNSAGLNFPLQDNLGQTIYLTGEQLYCRFNLNLQLIGIAPISDAPAPTSFEVLALGAIVATDADTITAAFTPTPVPTGFSLVVRATGPKSPGRSFVSPSEFRFIQSVAAAGTSPVNIAAAYTARFGSLANAVGQKIFVEIFLVDAATGQAGQKVRASHIVTAA